MPILTSMKFMDLFLQPEKKNAFFTAFLLLVTFAGAALFSTPASLCYSFLPSILALALWKLLKYRPSLHFLPSAIDIKKNRQFIQIWLQFYHSMSLSHVIFYIDYQCFCLIRMSCLSKCDRTD